MRSAAHHYRYCRNRPIMVSKSKSSNIFRRLLVKRTHVTSSWHSEASKSSHDGKRPRVQRSSKRPCSYHLRQPWDLQRMQQEARRQLAKSKLAAVALAVGVFNYEIILTHLLRSSSRPHKSCWTLRIPEKEGVELDLQTNFSEVEAAIFFFRVTLSLRYVCQLGLLGCRLRSQTNNSRRVTPQNIPHVKWEFFGVQCQNRDFNGNHS